MKDGPHQKALSVEVDNYGLTVLALCAVANEILFDEETRELVPQASVHCGRKFETSAGNRRSPSTSVHPDLAIVRSQSYGVIAEAKLGFGTDEDLFSKRVDETVAQMEKYDDDLQGWPGQIDGSNEAFVHDLLLLANFEDAIPATRELKARREAGSFVVDRRLAIVSCLRLTRAEGEWPTLVLEDGGLADSAKTTKLQDRIPINPGILGSSTLFGLVKVYDAEPPLPILMDLVHKAIAENLTPEEQDEYNVQRQVEKTISISQLCEWVSVYAFKRTDERDPVIPKVGWIRKAVRKLVNIGWAEPDPEDKNTFVYYHK